MNRCSRLCVALLTLLVLAAAGASLWAAQALARTRTWGEREEGEVVVNDQVVMRIRSAAGGYSATQRAEAVAARLNQAFAAGLEWRDLRVGEVNHEMAVLTTQGTLIATADRFHAQVNGTTPTLLARAWHANLVQALGGQVTPQGVTEGAGSASSEVSWEAQDKKVVPIFSLGTPGVSIGAAQVVGPAAQVAQVKAVGQIEAEFRGAVRARIYVPVSAVSTRPQRVQGVSVSALIDYRLPL